MLKKTFEYTDYDGDKVVRECYFHFSQSEFIEMEMEMPEGYSGFLQSIIDEEDRNKLIQTFKKFILRAYGEKSSDGQRFVKSEQLSEEFYQSPAYDQMFMSFFTDPNAAAEFMNGVVPAELRDRVAAATAAEAAANTETVELPDPVEDIPSLSPATAPAVHGIEKAVVEPADTWENYSRKQLLEMPSHQFKDLVGDIGPDTDPALLAISDLRNTQAE